MIYNNRQSMGLTGKRYSPSWNTFYAEKADRLPDLMKLADQKQYQAEQTKLADKSLNLERQNLMLSNKARKDSASNAETANIISGVGMGLQGLNTINQMTDGGVEKFASGAWDSVSGAWDALPFT